MLFIENNSENGMKIRENVCCCCGRLLKYDEVNYIDMKDLDTSKDISLKQKQNDGLITTIVKKDMLSYYTYKGPFAESWMSDDNHEYLISPRSCALKNQNKYQNTAVLIIIALNISYIQVARMQYVNKIFQSEVLTTFYLEAFQKNRMM